MDPLDHLDLSLDAIDDLSKQQKSAEELAAEEAAKKEAEEKEKEEAEKKAKEKEEEQKKEEQEKKEKKEDDDDEEGNNDDDDDQDNDDSFVSQIKSSFGFEELEEEDFEDSEEGLQNLTVKASEVMARRSLQKLFSQDPILEKHFQYMQQGGDSTKFMETFYPENDWNKVTLSEEAEESQLTSVIRADLAERGFSEEEIKDTIDDYKIAESLEKHATRALSNLKARQGQKQEQLIEQQKEQVAKQQKEAEESWNKVTETINNSKDLAGFPIKQAEKDKFLDYISKPIDAQGTTKRMQDLSKLSMEQALALDFLLYKGFDLTTLVNTKAKSQQAESLRDKLKGGKVVKNNKGKDSKNSKNNSKSVIDDIDFSKL